MCLGTLILLMTLTDLRSMGIISCRLDVVEIRESFYTVRGVESVRHERFIKKKADHIVENCSRKLHLLELLCISCMSWKPNIAMSISGLTADQPNPLSSRESEWY